MPKVKNASLRASKASREAEVLRVRVGAITAAEYEAVGVESGGVDNKTLARAARAAYERFIIEAGFKNDARIKDWKNLDYTHQRRWASIARTVIETSRGIDRRGVESGVQRADDRADGLRQGVRSPVQQKSADRNRGARRSKKV